MTETTAARGPRLPHVDALDGLRGGAVLAVLLHHAGHLRGGWLGVDLFFVLSGYLITALLLQGWRDGKGVGLRNFWIRRFRRLGPALIITLVATGIYAATIALETERLSIRWDGMATLFEVANWRTILTGGDYWASQLRPSPLRHTWSLSIEEQLYLLWPLVLAFVLGKWKSAKAVLAVAGALAIGSAVAMVGLGLLGASQARLYYGTDTRASAVLLGAALAAGRLVVGKEKWAKSRPLRHSASIVAAIVLVVWWVWLDGSSSLPYRGLLPLAGVLGALVIAGVADRHNPGPVGKLLALPPLVTLGKISYGVYLYHWPLYLVVDEARTGLNGWALTALRIALTILLAWASYRWIEEPVRSGRVLVGRQGTAAVPAGAALAAIALFAGTLGATQPAGILASVDAKVDRAMDPNAPLVMVVGDSVPLLLGAELSQQTNELGVSVINRSVPGCHLLSSIGPVRGTEGNVRTDVADCTAGGQYRKDAKRYRPEVSVVLFGEFPNQAVQIDGRWSMPCESTYLDATKDKLTTLATDLTSAGGKVVLVTAPGSSLSWLVERVEPGMDERVACTNALLNDVAQDVSGTTVVDFASFICPPGQKCKESVEGVNLRVDGLHFEGEGAAYANRWLIPRVLESTGLN